VKQEPAEATMRNCHGNAVGIFVIHGEEDVNFRIKRETFFRSRARQKPVAVKSQIIEQLPRSGSTHSGFANATTETGYTSSITPGVQAA
jgi:hypothetical protein